MQEAVARLRDKVHAVEPLSAAEHEAWHGTSSSSTGKRRKKKEEEEKSSRRLLFLVVGVLVIVSDKFQQLFEFFVPQVQFLDRMVDIPVVQQRQVLTVFFSVLVQFFGKVVVPVLCVVRWCRKLWRSPAVAFHRRSSTSPSVLQKQILMVQSIQRIIQTLQLPLVFRWSMSLLCLSCRFSGAAVERRRFFFCRQAQMIGILAGMAQKDSYAATQRCLAGFAGDDTARAVFLDKGLNRCVQRQVLAVSVLNCGGPQLQFFGQLVRRLRRLLEEFTIFSW